MSDFANWYVEMHPTETGVEIAREVAKHLAVRIMTGNAIIVCDPPENKLSVYRKRWKRILRLLENQYAATQSTIIKNELKEYSTTLEATQFLVGEPDERIAPTVWLVAPDDLDRIPKFVTSIYVTTDLTQPQLLYWLRQLKDEGVLLVFRSQELPANTEAKRGAVGA